MDINTLAQVFTVPTGVLWSAIGFLFVSGVAFWANTNSAVNTHKNKIEAHTDRIDKLEAKHEVILEKLDRNNDNLNQLRLELRDKQDRKP